MTFQSLSKSILAVSMVAMLSSCAPKIGGNDYSVKGAGEISQTYFGVITAARPVTVHAADPTKPGMGAVAGAGTGAVLGSLVGRGATPWLVGAAGALAGGAAGHVIEQKATEQTAMEYEVKLDSGGTITLAQGEPFLAVGQRVKVIQSAKDRSRVVPA